MSKGHRIFYKARCCLCVNLQETFRDFDPDNLYAPIVKQETIWMFVAKITAQKLKVEGADVDNAYLYSDMYKHEVQRTAVERKGFLKMSAT